MQSAHCRQPVGPQSVPNNWGMWLLLPPGSAPAQQWSGPLAMAEPPSHSLGELSGSPTDESAVRNQLRLIISSCKHETA